MSQHWEVIRRGARGERAIAEIFWIFINPLKSRECSRNSLLGRILRDLAQ